MNKTKQDQLELFRQAVALLGGQHAAARALDVGERTIRALVADLDAPNRRELHDGFLRDIGTALLAHADQCRKLERQLSPAFAGNLTVEQLDRQGKPDTRRYDQREPE